MKGGEKACYVNTKNKKSKVVILTSDEIDIRIRNITGDEEHFIMIKGSIHQEGVIILNMYAINEIFKIHEAECLGGSVG